MDTKVVTRTRTLPVEIAIGALASSGAVTFSNPMEVVKTRLQLQGELQKKGVYSKQYRGLVHGLWTIFKNEGIRGIQKGLFLAYPYTITMNGIRLGSYDTFKRKVASITGLDQTNVLVAITAAASSGVIGSIFANPFYVAKTRLQAQSVHAPVGHQHHYQNAFHALKSIYSNEGVGGYFRGVSAACIRIATASSAQLPTYDIAKRYILSLESPYLKDGLGVHFLASLISSAVLVCALNPSDVVTTRLQNQEYVKGKGVTYSGVIDCFLKVSKTEGFNGFYKGTLTHLSLIHI
eukprot:TRINITY_DN5989_c0_g1_i3.p1 TRINITY_DN5989_c0_g1~~TRINITY_DN5989_c0_g1_i3.p1  ORF type:complete len:292 (-),score=22.08 TRINITY_DN5989_c0_g1_i3:26-901(-)